MNRSILAGILLTAFCVLLAVDGAFAKQPAAASKPTRRWVTPSASSQPDLAQTGQMRRVALLIGNAAYRFAPLANPLNDVRLLAATLKSCGFDVQLLENQSRKGMIEALKAFEENLAGKDAGLFYFSGHGLQIKGENFLVPVDAEASTESQISYECFEARRVIDAMQAARARVNIIILDACRNNPIVRSSRSISGGLAKMEAGDQMIIAYSTSPGDVAQDGSQGGNSPYLANLVKQLTVPGQEIESMFRNVRRGVLRDTGNMQKPWEHTSLVDSFSFVPGTAPSRRPPEEPVSANPAGEQPATEDLTGGSISALEKAAERGDARAQEQLGNRYENGDGVARNPARAFEWYRKAAAQGLARAQYRLGNCYHDGFGVAKNFSSAAEWYEKASQQGERDAQVSLGGMYVYGEGVKQDFAAAAELYQRAALAGHPYAQMNMGLM
ncbi:MAG TPA: caspase family protein, partial [Candidatus Ozemobacteraceae bacterium]|nr:caspase family protein [Candidatus Ozemobacteraceae bacterium]